MISLVLAVLAAHWASEFPRAKRRVTTASARAPHNTPPAAIKIVNETINDILRNPEFVAKSLTPGGYTVTGGSPADLDATVHQDSLAWGALAKSINLQLD